MKRELILRNCDTDFYGDEILAEKHKFDDAYFQSIRDSGYTAIWICGRLRELVTFEEAPHWDKNNAARIEALNDIIARGKKHGVGIYLYVNEPRGFFADDPIYEKFPDLKGSPSKLAQEPALKGIEPDFAFCCKSTFTARYLTDGFAQLFTLCPGLAGVIMITTSEITSHCFSHVDERNLLNEESKMKAVPCPRCRETNGADTIVDIIHKIRDGIRRSSQTADIVAWNWSWGMHQAPPQAEMIRALPGDVAVMCDMQRGGGKTVEGTKMIVDEYSFSYLGPSPLFTGTADVCKETGRELWAKMMVNVTHEFLMTPYLPLFFRLVKKTIAIRDYNTRGWMGCWNYGGNATTPMAKLGSQIFTDDNFTEDHIDDAVRKLSQQLYGERADAAFRAWKEFDAAFEYFPFDMALIYYGPHMHGTGMGWIFAEEETPMPWYWMRNTGRTTNNLSTWCTYFSPEQIIHFLTKLTERWKIGVEILAEAFGVKSTFDAIDNFDELTALPGFDDFNIARTIYFHYLSTIAFLKFRTASLAYFKNEDAARQQEIILTQLAEEKPRIRAMRQIVTAYPRWMFQEEAQWTLYTADDLDERLANIDAFVFEEGQVI
jgi:hypothetical protein